MKNEQRKETIERLKELLEKLKEKNTDGSLTECCGIVNGVITSLDDSNPGGTPPPPPGGGTGG